jgi:hypothetical protein
MYTCLHQLYHPSNTGDYVENTLIDYKKEINEKIVYIKKLVQLKEKLRFVQLGADAQSRVEYRYMEKQVDKKIAETKKIANELMLKHKKDQKG